MLEQCVKKLKEVIIADNEFADVYDYEPSNLDATPVCSITPSGNKNDYRTTTENTRVYAFILRIYVKRLTGESEEEKADRALRQIVDSVIDKIDLNHQMSGLETQTGYTFILVKAAPSAWGYVGRENEFRTAEVEVQFIFSIDTTAIS